MIELPSVYNPKDYESKWYQDWQDKGLFHAEPDPKRKPYTILMPPPNVTSQLHMGHGTGYSIQDLLIRWRRILRAKRQMRNGLVGVVASSASRYARSGKGP